MLHHMDLTGIVPKNIYPLPPSFGGQNPAGETLSFTNYYMQIDGAPRYGVCGEIHYSRLWEQRWEDAIRKMKAGGVNIIASYVFWIHHEEQEGVFDFSGRRNLRRFVELCHKHGLQVIVRIGPFDHGECRNGGLPDWLYGKPFEVRSLDEGFLAHVRRLYGQLAQQLQGLYYKDGGPIIGTQIDNEYMHSAAPWEQTTGCANEWVGVGDLGDAYLLRLRDIAREEGIDTPFYTCTGWGGAATPEAMMPLWGGYAFRPWIFYSHKGEHPATEEYIYRDNHNDSVPATYNFEPCYAPETKPYLCCEMGGGMFCSYNYRFRLQYESVDAMANIKMASGCNMLGYYMYHGGSNPKGTHGMYLNEGQVPKISYDFQAPLGEFGQVRESFRRLRALHLFAASFEKSLCRGKTVLPEGSQDIAPEDSEALRYAVRLSEDGAGFLFINNYQDHAEMSPKQDERIALKLSAEEISFGPFSLAAGENCVLPFNLLIGGVRLRSAMAQPLTTIDVDGQPCTFFFAPKGMRPGYTFEAGTVIKALHGDVSVSVEGETVRVELSGGQSGFLATQGDCVARFETLSHEQAMRFDKICCAGREIAVLSDGVVLASEDSICVEHEQSNAFVALFPAGAPAPEGAKPDGMTGIFARYSLEGQAVSVQPTLRKIGPTRYTVELPCCEDGAADELILRLHYHGDIGHAFIDGELISDNFCNGAPWEIALGEFAGRLKDHPLTIYITPIKQSSSVNVTSVMAGRKEDAESSAGALTGVDVRGLYKWRLPMQVK